MRKYKVVTERSGAGSYKAWIKWKNNSFGFYKTLGARQEYGFAREEFYGPTENAAREKALGRIKGLESQLRNSRWTRVSETEVDQDEISTNTKGRGVFQENAHP